MSSGFYNIDCSLYGGSGNHRIMRNPDEMTVAEKISFCEPGINTYRKEDDQPLDVEDRNPDSKIDIDK